MLGQQRQGSCALGRLQTINYTPNSTTYSGANSKIGTIDLSNGIAGSNVFTEKTIDGTDYLVLPMAGSIRNFRTRQSITLTVANLPTGAFLMDENGTKNGSDGTLTLSKVKNDKTLWKNGNDMAYGQSFLFCIPKETAEKMDAAKTPLTTTFETKMKVDRYNIYVASTNASSVQPVILVEPGVLQTGSKLAFAVRRSQKIE